MSNKILIISPHPDDETLGCGGTILKHKANGDDIYWMIVTNISTKFGWIQEKVKKRQQEIEKVSSKYGFIKTYKLDLPTTRLDEFPISEIILKTTLVFNEILPDTIYVNNRSDIHTDHHIVFQAIMSCSKSFRYPFLKKILMYETLSETEFAPALAENGFFPNVFVDITEYFNEKVKIMQIYESEIMHEPLPRSITSMESLSKFRGSRIGVKYAESFMLIFQRM